MHPSAAILLAGLSSAAPAPLPIEQVGDILVMPGDDAIVLRLPDGSFTLEDPLSQDPRRYPTRIAERVLALHPDAYDGIAIFTSFSYQSTYAAVAICSEQVAGLGGGTGACPGPIGGLLSVTVLKDTAAYADAVHGELDFIRLLGHEWGHSWSAFYRFRDPASHVDSSELLSSDGAHWSPAVQSGGSFVGGVSWRDDGDGTFTMIDVQARYGALDLYGMGLLAPAEVPPFFIVRREGGLPIDEVAAGLTVRGSRLDLTIDDVIASVGPRVPTWTGVPRRFRQAFVLVTRPDETGADVADRVALLERLRQVWEDRFADETRQRASLCTDVDGDCPASGALVSAIRIDGPLEPGASPAAVVTYRNNRLEATTAASGAIETSPANPGLELSGPSPLPPIPIGGQIETRFPITVSAAACGSTTTLLARGVVADRTWMGALVIRPGLVDGPVEGFATAGGWQVDGDGSDTATGGVWGHGRPEWAYGHGGADDPAWFTAVDEHWYDGGVGGGVTTLTSPELDLTTVYRPTLRYYLFYNAVVPGADGFTPVDGSHFRVEASVDGGASWVVIQTIAGTLSGWVQQEVALDDLFAPDAPVRVVHVRFSAEDDDGAERIVVAGIDDVEVFGLSEACRDAAGADEAPGCGCGAGAGPGAWPAWLGLALLGGRGRVRRRRPAGGGPGRG